MKNLVLVVCFFVSAAALFGKGAVDNAALADERAKLSYAFGQVIGSDLQQLDLEFDYGAFTEGFRASVSGNELLFTLDEAVAMVQAAFQEAMARQAEARRLAEVQFLAENAEKDTVITTESGLQYEILEEGNGERPAGTDVVMVNYEGSLIDGTVFDSSYNRGEAAEIPLDRVIPGWSEGIQLMTVGSSYRFYIPSNMAYGGQGAGQVIPPYSTLIFQVELLEIIQEEVEEGASPE
jgi:FKBP-type peptidyl-prolyl cis-trans isomerase FkpA